MNHATKSRLGRALRVAQPFTPAELKAAQRWYREVPLFVLLRLRVMRGGGRFCVVQGDYSRARTADLQERLMHLEDHDRGRSPSAVALRMEIAKRRGAQRGTVKPTDPRPAA